MSGFVFNLERPQPENPAISVICINKNHGNYLEDTILSVLGQKFDNYEFIIADGGSTDDSLAIIEKYPFIRLVSGADASRIEGLNRALAAARGRYVMVTTSTDGYLSRDWFASVASVLDRDPRVSLVFGASAAMSGEGTLGAVTWPTLFPFYEVPAKEKWPGIWLMNGFAQSYLPELNYCVRMDVFRRLFGPSTEFPELNDIDPILRFHFEFNRHGYLPQYLPTLANFGRTHANQEQLTERNQGFIRVYDEAWKRYREEVFSGRLTHLLRDGKGQPFAQVSLNSGAAA
jgi:glycosyltransferase involved in cell wall biosynthesis